MTDEEESDDENEAPLSIAECISSSSSDEYSEEETPSTDQSGFQCNCGKRCLSKMDRTSVEEHIMNIKEMTKDEKDLYVMGAVHKVNPDQKRSRYGERKRTRYDYRYEGHKVCRKAFTVIYDISEATLKRLIKHLCTYGNIPRVHRSKGRKPKHALAFSDIEKLVKFIQTYSTENGLPQPAAPRGRDDVAPVFLPAYTTKKSIHGTYAEACQDTSSRIIQYKTFCKIWNHCCPHIKVNKTYFYRVFRNIKFLVVIYQYCSHFKINCCLVI